MLQTFNNLTPLQKNLVVAIVSLVLFVTTAGASYSVFSKMTGVGGSSASTATALPSATKALAEDPSAPKTEACPLNGSMHTKDARASWEARRPLAVMIENHQDARPQSGISSADVVYEAVAEGGITRFMAVFYCNLSDVQVGPVRSARTYFIDWLSEYDALYAHVGGANTPGPADALGQIIKYDIKDLNQFGIGFPTYWRDYQRLGHPVATEHTMYSTTQKLWAVGAQRGWTATDSSGLRWDKNFVKWTFKDGQSTNPATVGKINVNFWEGYSDYGVVWNYDAASNTYKRVNGGQPHMDLDTNQQLAPTTVIVQFMRESHANDGYEANAHLLYQNKGTGRALVFEDGKVTEGTWNKADRLSREKFLDKSGKEIALDRGQIWIETVPEGSTVSY